MAFLNYFQYFVTKKKNVIQGRFNLTKGYRSSWISKEFELFHAFNSMLYKVVELFAITILPKYYK